MVVNDESSEEENNFKRNVSDLFMVYLLENIEKEEGEKYGRIKGKAKETGEEIKVQN